jgi:hypothetical protein
MNNCNHTWLYIGSKRQKIWRCTLCDEYRIDDPNIKREWKSLTDEEMLSCLDRMTFKESLLAVEAKLKEKNNGI